MNQPGNDTQICNAATNEVTRRRRFIVRLDSSRQIPKEWEPIRVLAVEQEPDGAGANFHYVYVCLCEEVDV